VLANILDENQIKIRDFLPENGNTITSMVNPSLDSVGLSVFDLVLFSGRFLAAVKVFESQI
jgi:hypothetical protein